jgi:uncharacterized protein (TIGR03084 family)
MPDVKEIAADLQAEQQALDDVVAGLTDEQWATPTPSEGWTVADQIGHLTYFDGSAALAITDPDAFKSGVEELMSGTVNVDQLTLGRGKAPAQMLADWRANRRHLTEVSATLTNDQRIAWYGPSMSSRSFLTARMMECWAHGQDIVDAVDGDRPPTDRLRHIAQLGFITRGWSYVNRGLHPPDADVRVELTAPSGEVWEFGGADDTDVVTGPAVDFCLVVTQRRHVEDTALVVKGEAARDWMEKAQAFAGPASEGPRPKASS